MRVDFQRTWPPFSDFVQMLLEAGLYFDSYEADPQALKAEYEGTMFYIVSLISNSGRKRNLGLAWVSDITPPHSAKVHFVADRSIRDESVLSKAPSGNAPSLVKRDIWLMFETICFDALGVNNIIAEAIEGQVTARALSGLGIHQIGVMPKALSISGPETSTELGIAIYAQNKENSLVSTLGNRCPDRTITHRTGGGADRKRDHPSRIDPRSAEEGSATGGGVAAWSGPRVSTPQRQRYREGGSLPTPEHGSPANVGRVLPDEGGRTPRRRRSRTRGRKPKS